MWTLVQLESSAHLDTFSRMPANYNNFALLPQQQASKRATLHGCGAAVKTVAS